MITTPIGSPSSWLASEITDGLQRLSVLGLARTPQPDILPITSRIWLSAVAPYTSWDRERDTPRIRDAFATLLANRTSWPAPRDFFDALPPRPEPVALPAPAPVISPENKLKLRLLQQRLKLWAKSHVISS